MEWKAVPGYEDYEVSSAGAVRRQRNQKRNYMVGRLLKPKLSKHGYLVVSLFADGKYYHVGVHRLVCMAFNGVPDDPTLQVCHGDGDRTNNVPANLRWGTAKENCDDRKRHGNWECQKGSEHHEAKLTEQAVAEMRRMRRGGASFVAIAAKFQVHKVTARDAIVGKTWVHVDEKPVIGKSRKTACFTSAVGAAREAESQCLQSEQRCAS